MALLGGNDLLSYEFAVGEKTTLQPGFGYGGFKIADVGYQTYGVGVQFRYYFKEAIKGFYGNVGGDFLSGKTFINDYSTDNKRIEFNFTSFGGLLGIGYQWAWDSGFLLDLNLRASYNNFKYDLPDDFDENQALTLRASGVLPGFGVAIGYHFGDSRGRGGRRGGRSRGRRGGRRR